ncbi:MAG TPA: hypothetical protein VM869_06555 [Enhygromyxa sp.]|nr:hypothetical protein [Enhygromyxa sp.]
MDEARATLRRFVDGVASITFDGRHAPVLVATWAGAPTLAVIARAQAWLDDAYADARADGLPGLVIISEASHVQLPSLEARRRLLELRHDPELMLAVIAVVPVRNAVVHGLLRALAWALDSRFGSAVSFEQALDLAARAFAQRGLAIPDAIEQLRIERRG